jgi:enoyl-CoA hydratase
MTDVTKPGTVRTETDGRVFKIEVDNVAKKNAFTPEMMEELSEAFTTFDTNNELWVALLCFAGDHTTAGPDMPKFFGPTRERGDSPPGNVDPFTLRRRTLKRVVAAVQGLCLTVGIENVPVRLAKATAQEAAAAERLSRRIHGAVAAE